MTIYLSNINKHFTSLLEIFAPDTINDIFYNPSNGLDKHLKHNQFSDAVSINNNYGFVRVPKGLVFMKMHIVLVGNALKGEGRRIELRIRISFQNLSIKEGVCRNISYLIFF